MPRRPTILALAALILSSCAAVQPDDEREEDADTARPGADVHSRARPDEVAVRHVSLDLRADFAEQTLSGTATLTLQRDDPAAALRLDASGLEIRAVRAGREPLVFGAIDPDPVLGEGLRVDLPLGVDRVTIEYSTRPDAAALQWLEPSQTDGGQKPFLFSQGQAILTRTWIPLQDSPGVRVTYDATIRLDPALGLVPVMSANVREEREPGTVVFSLDKPVPPYLIAVAIGDLARRELSVRSAVWAEPGVVDRAAQEFADTESMIVACEGLYGPYRWGRYDILVLPPSFPFGGMENPCLTFATPTILAGDRSLVALIAHELAHSWSGNLVTNATWRDFWLNEGFTVYLEQRIVEEIYGPARARMETILGLRQLAKELRSLPKRDQVLHVDLRGRNPDDGMTAIADHKGAAFLRRLEQEVGRERFDVYLRGYFDRHAFQSITTDVFLDDLDEHLSTAARAIDLDAWVRGPGLPTDHVEITSAEFDRVVAARSAWLGGADATSLTTDDWATPHWLHFLGGLPADLTAARMADLDRAFAFTESGNAEIAAAWLERAVRHDYRAADERLERFLLRVGRRKFLQPIYTALVATPEGKERARRIYAAARPRYHAVSRRTLDSLLENRR